MTTFLGSPGIGNIRGEESFPKAAKRALQDTQMRRNVGAATKTIREKRLGAVAECDDWEELRLAGSALKTDVMSRLPELLQQLEANVTARGEWCTGHATPTRPIASSRTSSRPRAATRWSR